MGDPAKGTVAVTGTAPATVVAYPPNYWEYGALSLDLKDLDDEGAKKYRKRATAPLSYIKTLQTDLGTLGYFKTKAADGYYGGGTKRAVTRFQRHAGRVYRMVGASKTAADVAPADVFSHAQDGVCDQDTAKEVRKWITNGWVNPVGRFKLVSLSTSGKMREDAAAAWETIVTAVNAAGGTLAGPYDSAPRPLAKTSNNTASIYSFHYTGRAVDINQSLSGARGVVQVYFVAKEAEDGNVVWRIWCRTEKQDGTQGAEKQKGEIKCWDFSDHKEYDIKAGFYVDLTDMITSGNTFERIPAHGNWNTNYDATEWWHFQYSLDKQATFEDELELIGFTEQQIKDAGWSTDAELDHKPG
jgi:peptidoglycan hydrolase-like protein with peptidoglycan-binding domain